MLLAIVLDIEWQTVIFGIICLIVGGLILSAIPEAIWVYFIPFFAIGVIVVGFVTYIIWYLTSYLAGWYDWSYWAVFGIGMGITISYFVIYSLIERYNDKK